VRASKSDWFSSHPCPVSPPPSSPDLRDEAISILFRLANEFIGGAAKAIEVELQSAAGGFGHRRRVARHAHGHRKSQQQQRKDVVADVLLVGEFRNALEKQVRHDVRDAYFSLARARAATVQQDDVLKLADRLRES